MRVWFLSVLYHRRPCAKQNRKITNARGAELMRGKPLIKCSVKNAGDRGVIIKTAAKKFMLDLQGAGTSPLIPLC